MRVFKSGHREAKVGAGLDPRLRKDRVFRSEALLGPQIRHPFDDDLSDGVADRKEPSGEGLGALRAHLPCILFEQFAFEVDMLQFEGDDGAIARAGQNRKGDERAVAPLDFRRRPHCVQNELDLRERRAWTVSMRRRDARQIFRRVEIFRVGLFDAGAVVRFFGEPENEGLEDAEGRIYRGSRQWRAGPCVALFHQVRLEPARLFDMKFLQIAPPVIAIKALKRLGHSV